MTKSWPLQSSRMHELLTDEKRDPIIRIVMYSQWGQKGQQAHSHESSRQPHTLYYDKFLYKQASFGSQCADHSLASGDRGQRT